MTPALAAHLRLISTLPVRTHERIYYSHQQGSKLTPQIIVAGKAYRSRLAVRQHFRIGKTTLDDWLSSGKAKYA